ncbi:hypothetical protein LRP88_11363 [Fusarium phalaenopsidis]
MEVSMNDMQERFRQAMEQQQQQYQQTINEQQNRIDRLTTLQAQQNDLAQQQVHDLGNLTFEHTAAGTTHKDIGEIIKPKDPEPFNGQATHDYIDMTIKIDNRQFERRMEKSNKGRIWGNKNNANQSRRREQTRGNTSYGTHAGPMELGAAQKDSKDIECYYCHKKGHKANECRKKQGYGGGTLSTKATTTPPRRKQAEGNYMINNITKERLHEPVKPQKNNRSHITEHVGWKPLPEPNKGRQQPGNLMSQRTIAVTRRAEPKIEEPTTPPSAQQPSNEQADFQEAAAEGFDHKKWIVGYEEKEQLLVPATVHRRDCRQDDPTRCNHTLCPRHQIEASREYDEICERQKQTNTADCHAMIGLPRQAVATSIELLEHKARQLQRELRQERSRKPRKSDKELWEEEDYPQLYDENNNRTYPTHQEHASISGCRANTIGAKPTERRSKSKIASPSHYHINQTINPTYGTKRKGTKWYTGEETDHHKIEDWQKTISQENEEDPGAEQERQYQDWLHKKDDTHDYDACANSELDSGAEQNYFDPTTANRLRLPWRYKQTPYSVVNPEGTPFDYNNGIIDSEIDHLKVFVEGKNQGISFDVVPNKQHDLVLGYPWLQRFNPHFDWKTGQVLSFNDETPSTANDDSEYDTRSQTSTEGTGEARQRPTRDTSPPTGQDTNIKKDENDSDKG